MFKLEPIKGLDSIPVLNVYQSIIIGLKMMPMYQSEKDEDFLERIHEMSEKDREKIFREGAQIVPLETDEIRKLLKFYKDKNGVPLSRENIGALTPFEIIEMIVTVCLEISRMKIDFVTEAEKKT
jgi:hypothetical protein